jgi:hypothetical protein
MFVRFDELAYPISALGCRNHHCRIDKQRYELATTRQCVEGGPQMLDGGIRCALFSQ